MSDVEFLTFTDNVLTIQFFLDDAEALQELKNTWENEVKSCQAPLVGTHKNGFTLFIPWIMKTPEDEVVDPEEPDEWSYSEPEENDI